MAHYGKQTGNVSMQVEACRWYDKGLRSQLLDTQQTDIQIMGGQNPEENISEAMIVAPVMFSLFESLMSTSFAAWSKHMLAAARMLEMRGPQGCQIGVIHLLFRRIRLATIPSILPYSNQMRAGSSAATKNVKCMVRQAVNLQTDQEDWVIQKVDPYGFRDAFVARNVAFYDAGIIVVLSLASEASTSGLTPSEANRIVIHCESIMSAVAYHEDLGPYSGSTTEMIFPLKTICRATPSAQQKQRAYLALARWGSSRGVDGICKFGLPLQHAINDRGHGLDGFRG
ncbi:hypothetical protein ACLMJK_009365 [Lecanora helva]